MKETLSHSDLRNILYQWIQTYCIDNNILAIIQMDHGGVGDGPTPPKIGDSIPDVYAAFLSSSSVIIGEAKTGLTLLSNRTEDQFKDYLRYCNYNGNSIFVLSVPWDYVRRARLLLRSLKSELGVNDVKIVVIEEHGIQSHILGKVLHGKTIS
jgi:hypothetical protein